MHVIATAGHVDHGKSTLVRALTGSDPDRLEEERRRGLTISLGYCWTELPGVGEVAFVDVPGHERFLATMLSGVGPVPAVLFVVAADDAWMPQAAEHLAALDAFGVRHGVVAVTRSDLADPEPIAARTRAELGRTALRGAPIVSVSGRTGHGIDELRDALTTLAAALPVADPRADVRLWVDRSFTVHGAGTVVTGTLTAGTIARGDRLALGDGEVRVRGIEALGRSRDQVSGVARVALNLGSKVPDALGRDSVLVTPDAWQWTTSADVVLQPANPDSARSADVPGRADLVLHIGAVAEHVHFRALGAQHARLLFHRPLPLRIGDRAILRDPGSRRLWGVTVVDPIPPAIDRRGAARRRAFELATAGGEPAAEVQRRSPVRASLLRRIGIDPDTANAVRVGDWLLAPDHAAALRTELTNLVATRSADQPLDPGLPLTTAAQLLALPSAELVRVLVSPPLRLAGGRVLNGDANLPPDLLEAIAKLTDQIRQQPYRAPEAAELEAAGLDKRALAAADRAHLLLRLADTVVLLPGADETAVRRLAHLPQPFTASEARRCLDSTRRVVVPLLEHLDRRGLTRRLPDGRRTTVPEPTVERQE
ncbi:selenocysteine-specific translation elongation factor [Kribbella sp. NPDC054772]